MTIKKDQYAVFGNPIAHSKSPVLQSTFARQTHQALEYKAVCVPTNRFTEYADQFFSSGGKGLNITVPFKLDAYHYAHKLSHRATVAGAVNTLIMRNSTIIGDNTDGVGFVNDVKKNLHWIIKNKHILILGAGGAVRGALEPILDEQPASIVIANRTFEKAEILAKNFSSKGNVLASTYKDLNRSFDMIINGTSASLSGNLPTLPDHIISPETLCYDMMYGKEPTVFLEWASLHHAKDMSDGLGMLVCQGAESFYQWRNVRPDTQPVINDIRANL